MAFNTDFEEEVQGNGCKENGLHTVKLVRVGSKDTKMGSKQLSLTVDDGGKFPVTFYSFIKGDIAPSYRKADGSESWLQKRILNPLAYLTGATSDLVEDEMVDTKNGEVPMPTFVGFPKGITFRIAVQNQWNDYSSKFQPVVIAIFNEQGLTAKEKQSGVREPNQIKKYLDIGNGEAPKGASVKKPEVSDVNFDEADDVF